MEKYSDGVLQGRPADHRLGGREEENIPVEVVLDEDDRVRRYAQESLNLMRNSFGAVIEVDQPSDTQTDLIPRDSALKW